MKNYNEDNSTGKNHGGSQPNLPLKLLACSSMIGGKVNNTSGKYLGKVKDVMIELSTGKIEYFVIELGGFFGIGDKYFAFPYSLVKVDTINQSFTLDQDPEIIKKAPGFDKSHWSMTNRHAYSSANSYWGGFMGPNTGSSY